VQKLDLLFSIAQQPVLGQGNLLIEDTQTHHTRLIGSSPRPLPDNTQHSQETDIHTPAAFEPATPASERKQTDALDSAASEICKNFITVEYMCTYCEKYSNKNILRSAGNISKSSEPRNDTSEVQPPPLHFFKK